MSDGGRPPDGGPAVPDKTPFFWLTPAFSLRSLWRNETVLSGVERTGPPDGGPALVNPSRFPTRPAKPRFKSFYSGLKPENFLSLQPLRVHGRRPSFVWIAHPRPPLGPAPPLFGPSLRKER